MCIFKKCLISDNVEPPNKKRKGILGEIFGEIDLESKEGKKLIALKSENSHLIQLVSVINIIVYGFY